MTADCCSEVDPSLLTLEQAIAKIQAAITPISGSVSVALRDALQRTLAVDVCSAIQVPPFTNSAMDGYALRYQDAQAAGLTVVGTAFAGKPYTQTVMAGQCVRIMTGAVLPDGADTVIMQEQVTRTEQRMVIDVAPTQGQHVRYAGEDIEQGAQVLSRGVRLTPAHIAMLASVGIAEIPVVRPLRVAFFSTGDELIPLGQALAPGQIYDSNRYALHSLLRTLGAEILDFGVIPDDRAAIERAFETASACADVLLTSGGVSVGEADYVKETLAKLGEVNFWKMAVKPGKPLAFGHIGKTVFFGLPGNPVSAMATFYEIVLPGLAALSGTQAKPKHRFRVKLQTALKKAPGRLEFQRGVLSVDAAGETVVSTTGQQGSHMMTSMAQANCFILLPQESAGAEVGALVEVEPLYGMM